MFYFNLAIPKKGDVILIPTISFPNHTEDDMTTLECTRNIVVRTSLLYRYTKSMASSSCICHEGKECREWRWIPCQLYHTNNDGTRTLLTT